MIRPTRFVLAGLSLAALLASPAFAGSSGHDDGATSDASGHMAGMEAFEAKLADTSAFGMKGDPAHVSKTVTIEATEIKYDIEALQFKVGETIRFVLTNKGEQVHELTIGDAPYQEIARQMMAHMAEMGMDLASPEHAAQHASAGNTVVVPVGETKEIVWTFTKPGSFEFSCNMIGHPEVGMKGPIEVS
jgi:uncharacterized cupredoxin-like copper-binding protein